MVFGADWICEQCNAEEQAETLKAKAAIANADPELIAEALLDPEGKRDEEEGA